MKFYPTNKTKVRHNFDCHFYKMISMITYIIFIVANKDPVSTAQEVPNSRPPEPSRPPPPPPAARAPAAPHSQPPLPPVPANSGGLFSSIKGGAGSFLKNLKDTSSKVMQTVQQ